VIGGACRYTRVERSNRVIIRVIIRIRVQVRVRALGLR
jgi:hypothetical protein